MSFCDFLEQSSRWDNHPIIEKMNEMFLVDDVQIHKPSSMLVGVVPTFDLDITAKKGVTER